ncbi:MAG: hypothetical protein Kow00128_01020 [Deltaproteobacteria bacterium]
MIRIGALLVSICLAAGCAAGRSTLGTREETPYPLAAKPQPDEIRHVPTGLPLSIEGAIDILSGARLVCIGETHDNLHAHRVQLIVLRELERRAPGRVALGMEMFREPQQEALDRWTRGELSEIEFLKASKWYDNWGSDFGYYRDILNFARENRVDIVALNPARELQEAVSRTGLDNVSGELRGKLPEIGPPDPWQRAVLKGIFGGHLPTEGMFDSFLQVQSLWEETMASRIVDYLRSTRGSGKTMVILTGGWHVKYGFGIPKKVLRRMPMPYAILLTDEIEIPEEKKDQLMDVDLPDIPLLPADLIWYVPYEDLEGTRMRLGVRIADHGGRVIVERVEEGSPADKAGIPDGCEIVSFDGRPVEDTVDLFYRIGEKREGDVGIVVYRKDGVESKAAVTFFRTPRKGPHR